MVSFAVHRMPKLVARTLMLAAVALPYAGFSQSTVEPVAKDDQQEKIVAKIRGEQSLNGPYSADLIGPLTTLSLLYQEGGEHELAAAAIDQALQIVRFNYGLYSLDQAPLLQQSIHNEETRGNLAAAWEREQELLALARRHPEDLRTVPIFRQIADERMDVLQRYVSGEFPPELFLGCFYYADIGSCNSGSKGVAVGSILSDAWRNYADAIRTMLRHELYASDELRELEMQLVRTSYFYGSPDVGRRSLRRLIAYGAANSEPWLSRIDSLIQMTDWDLLYGGNGYALDTYKQAYDLLKEKGIDEASIEQIFSPPTPVVLPTFLPNPLAASQTEESAGYIDVAFNITKYGRGRQVEILDTTTNAPDAAKDELVHTIYQSRFRPRVTDGEFADRSPVVVRYYLSPQPEAPSRRRDR
jgi:hypothetical protein